MTTENDSLTQELPQKRIDEALQFHNDGNFIIKSNGESLIVITDELGRKILELELNSKNNFATNIFNLDSGIYFARIISGEFVMNKKIIIRNN